MNVTLTSLPETLPLENAVELVLEQGVIIFRASSVVQNHIEELLERQKAGGKVSEHSVAAHRRQGICETPGRPQKIRKDDGYAIRHRPQESRGGAR